MNCKRLDTVVGAVLYEGYILYPYRPSSAKNRQRFTFGRVYPQAYSEAQRGAEPCRMRTECLVEATDAAPTLAVSVRFLHPMAREAGRLPEPLPALPDGEEPAFELVPELRVGGRRIQTWQEAVERTVEVPPLALEPATRRVPFAFAASRALEPVRDEAEQVVGVLVRRQEALAGEVELSVEPVADGLFKVNVEIRNGTAVPEAALSGPDEEVVMRTLASTHTVLHVEGGAFVSLMDPPAAYQEAAAACTNTGTWPVLVGDEAAGERDAMLSSPIILYDYPQIAPESAGDLYDGLEIDEILTLRIQTMTDDEKDEMRAVDEHARRLLDRSEALPEDALLNMHGTVRETAVRETTGHQQGIRETRAFFDDPFFNPNTRLDGVYVGSVYCRAGDRVRIRPNKAKRADIMDLALDGKAAVIEAVEQDFENRVHLALVVEDDPGADLGMMRQPGHRFFFAPDEVEALPNEA